MKTYKFNLQYPKPLEEKDLSDLIKVSKSGNFSRYTSNLVLDLEIDLAKYYNTKYAVTCTSGTAALHGCLVALDFAPGSEIIMTSIADIGIVLPVIYENLVPVFADVNPETFNINKNTIEKRITNKTKAIIAVHLAGNPCNLDDLKKLCKDNNLILMEDFSQAHGALWNNKKIGSFGKISYGSFQQSKQITCGEGGVIVTNDKELKRRAFIGVDKAWQRELPLEKRFYEFLAPNLRFNSIQAAILKPQIKKLDKILNRKRKIAKKLSLDLKKYINYLRPQKINTKSSHAYYSYPLITINMGFRNKLVDILKKKYKLFCAKGYANPVPLYQCVNPLINPSKYGKQFYYSKNSYPDGLCPQAEDLLKKSFLIPFNENYNDNEIEDISNRLQSAIEDII